MCTSEDPRVEGMAGPPTPDSDRRGSIPGVQTGNGNSISNADSSSGNTQEHGVHGRSSQERDTVPIDINLAFRAKTWVPRKYQERGIDWLLRPEAALFLPPGLGKSSIALAAILRLKELGLPHRTLLLAPKTVCLTTWMTEPKKWYQFQGLKVGLAWGVNDRERELKDMSNDIVVMNYDGLPWAAPFLKNDKFAILLCDEITKLKNIQSKRFKILKPLLGNFKFRWGLTGTPVANGLLDLFGQVYVLDMGLRLGRYITAFRFNYFHQLPYDKFRYYITPEKTKVLLNKIEDLAMYVSEEEWLDLPELLHIPLSIELEQSTWEKYKFLEDEFILKMNDGIVTASNAGVLTSKLRQMSGGAVYTESPVWENVGTEKLERLDSLIDEMAGEPLMVAYIFQHELERLKYIYPEALVLKGGMTPKQVTETVDKWNTGTYSLLFVQPSTAALGLNLQFGGSALCWYTMTYNLEDFIQLQKRLHRSGQTKCVRCYMLLATKTIDERVSKVLTMKNSTQQDVFEALKLQM